MNEKLNDYLKLLSLPYKDAVAHLLVKYGSSKNNYFKEASYNRFLKGETSRIEKEYTSRTKDGLYCHHINENKYLNLAQLDYIKDQQPPFEVQRKENLVYCDLAEHVVLHTLISKETNKKFGYPGLSFFLIPQLGDWYINELVPDMNWEKNCYNKAFLTSEDAEKLLLEINLFLAQ